MHRSLILSLFSAITLAGCSDDGSSGSESESSTTHPTSHSTSMSTSTSAGSTSAESTTAAILPPAAPTGLKASILEGGVHVTWMDAADNEDNYVIESKIDGDEYTLVIELPFDSVTYHDANVTPATSYSYRVKAVNAGGEAASNEVMIAVP